jgi:hypothetical protein
MKLILLGTDSPGFCSLIGRIFYTGLGSTPEKNQHPDTAVRGDRLRTRYHLQ